MNTRSRRLPILAGVLALSLIAASCGDDDDESTADTSAETADTTAAGAETTEASGSDTSEAMADTTAGAGGGEELPSGSVFVTGSSTVEPITSLAAEQFRADNPDVGISVDGPGTGDGFELFCNGETDISDASRPIEQEEIDACEGNGIEYIELQIGLDGLSILTKA